MNEQMSKSRKDLLYAQCLQWGSYTLCTYCSLFWELPSPSSFPVIFFNLKVKNPPKESIFQEMSFLSSLGEDHGFVLLFWKQLWGIEKTLDQWQLLKSPETRDVDKVAEEKEHFYTIAESVS